MITLVAEDALYLCRCCLDLPWPRTACTTAPSLSLSMHQLAVRRATNHTSTTAMRGHRFMPLMPLPLPEHLLQPPYPPIIVMVLIQI